MLRRKDALEDALKVVALEARNQKDFSPSRFAAALQQVEVAIELKK